MRFGLCVSRARRERSSAGFAADGLGQMVRPLQRVGIYTPGTAIGGKSPLTEITCAQAQALGQRLGTSMPVAVGMRNWKPYIAAELNGQCVKLDKIKGEFIFHHHDHEDELFLVVKGRFRMEYLDHHEWIEEGEFVVVPRGVEHKPVAEEECWFLLFEPSTTLNTGNVVNERTHRELEKV